MTYTITTSPSETIVVNGIQKLRNLGDLFGVKLVSKCVHVVAYLYVVAQSFYLMRRDDEMGLGHYTLISKKWIGIILCDSIFIWLKQGQMQEIMWNKYIFHFVECYA